MNSLRVCSIDIGHRIIKVNLVKKQVICYAFLTNPFVDTVFFDSI